MDAQKMGTLAIESMKKFFNPRGHPRVAEGNKTEAQVYDEVFSVFSANRRKELTYQVILLKKKLTFQFSMCIIFVGI